MRSTGILFSLFFLFCLTANSQTTKHEPWIFKFEKNISDPFTQSEKNKISSALGDKKLENILSNTALSKFYKNILRNRISIAEKKYYAEENVTLLSEISLSGGKNFNDIDSFNPLLYNFPFTSQKFHYYRIDGTNLIVSLNPQKLK